MYQQKEIIRRYTQSPFKSFVDEWVDNLSDDEELIQAKANGNEICRTRHECYLKKTSEYVFPSADSEPDEVDFQDRCTCSSRKQMP